MITDLPEIDIRPVASSVAEADVCKASEPNVFAHVILILTYWYIVLSRRCSPSEQHS